MIRRVDLNGRSDLGAVADADFDDVEDDAVEVQEHAVADANVVAKVAEERRPDHGAAADMPQTLAQQRVPFRNRLRQCGIVADQPCLGLRLLGTNLGIGTI